ncbi:carbon monoxide dehydrogenase [Streptomyces sp. Tu 2975]|uniref:SRPBCC family protein n=1 Tax=Streptomyces sp. Tu 2975 TaxID=2676871 RepID=UPI00135A8D74|nr:SRPBCC family protein [Streptomyces sp. Tu 2975]QIP85471.1 carbon monoxide dehydrogenase [Streptomyces sp. Tu 2975]
MEHEVFVPVPAETLRRALRDPARVARCVPGLQQDADEAAGPLAGRLKVRVAGHTITYRGALRITEQDDERGGAFAVEGEGAEARGGGSVKVTLTIRPAPTDGGTTMTFNGSARAEGRLADLAAGAKVSAAHRLLDRFAEALAAAAFEDPQPGDGAAPAPEPQEAAGETADRPAAAAGHDAQDATGADDAPDAGGSVFDAPVPPPSLGTDADNEFEDLDEVDGADDLVGGDDLDGVDDIDGIEELDDLSGLPDEMPAEAAHARRTMIGRSAEEVDHAPPRGRYAPAPAPDASSAGATLRWLAPAAALALASAVVVGRALRRRR